MAKVLVLGSGSREHALAAALSAEANEVLVMPGNPGTATVARNLTGTVTDFAAVLAACDRERPDLVVVGPELPLVLGVADAIESQGTRVFGPSREAARLEGSKVFMKRFLARHGIPTAPFEVFEDAESASSFVRSANRPLVVKADGLAAGKGVVVAEGPEEALAAVNAMMRDRVFGEAGAVIVIEEVLRGEEASFHVICDGARAVPLVAAQDHKRVHDGDRGPNTGGMGAYAPAPIVTPEVHAVIMDSIVSKTLLGMAEEGRPFRGVLFVGLMIEAGVPTVLEFNVRFGDPEVCVILPLYQGHVLELLMGAATGKLQERPPQPVGHALAVVMAAEGYPAKPRVGDVIEGLSEAERPGAFVRHAGTSSKDGAIVTSGGRVLAVGAVGETLIRARDSAYAAVRAIHWSGEHHRQDIGNRALTPAGG